MIVPNPPLVAVYNHPAGEKTKAHETTLKVVFVDDDREAWVIGNDGTFVRADSYKNFVRFDENNEHVTSVIPALPGWRVLIWSLSNKNEIETTEIEIVAWESCGGELRPIVFDEYESRSAYASFRLDLGDASFVAVLGPASKLTERDKLVMARDAATQHRGAIEAARAQK